MTLPVIDSEIMDADYTEPQTTGAIVPSQSQAIDVTPEQLYQALPVHLQSGQSWGEIKRATPQERQEMYLQLTVDARQTHNYDNQTHNYDYREYHTHHHHEAPLQPPAPPQQPIIVPMPYPVYEQVETQPIVINNHVHGGNAFAHSQSRYEGYDGEWSGPRALACAFLVAACFTIVVGMAGGE